MLYSVGKNVSVNSTKRYIVMFYSRKRETEVFVTQNTSSPSLAQWVERDLDSIFFRVTTDAKHPDGLSERETSCGLALYHIPHCNCLNKFSVYKHLSRTILSFACLN